MPNSPYSDEVLRQAGVASFVNFPDNPRATPKRQGAIFQRWEVERERMHAATRLDPELIDHLQLERIRHVVDSAFITHPFYHQLYSNAGYSTGEIITWDDYHSLPTVSKAQLHEARELFPGRALAPSECYADQTSGSTGSTLTVFQDDAATASSILSYMRFYEQVLGRTRQSDEMIYRVYSSALRFTSFLGNYPIFTLSPDCPPESTLKHIARSRPAIFKAPPSYLSQMIRLGRPLNELGIMGICTHSESSTAEERRGFSVAFAVDVFDEYASQELHLIATQCRYGRHHIVEDNIRADVTRDGAYDGVGQLVATTLTNDYMPFIRYLQGDVVELEGPAAPCECGSTFRVMSKLYGREDELLRRRDGSLVDLDRVVDLYNTTLIPQESGVAQCRIYQLEPGVLEIFVQPVGGNEMRDGTSIDAFTTGLREIYASDELSLSVKVVERIRRPRPKRPSLVVAEPPMEI